jgi:hypothetical protein
MLVGYEGDGGHVYKVWDPTNKKLVVSRDIGFPQPGDDDDDISMTTKESPTDPKDPDDDDVVGFMPILLTPSETQQMDSPRLLQKINSRSLPS